MIKQIMSKYNNFYYSRKEHAAVLVLIAISTYWSQYFPFVLLISTANLIIINFKIYLVKTSLYSLVVLSSIFLWDNIFNINKTRMYGNSGANPKSQIDFISHNLITLLTVPVNTCFNQIHLWIKECIGSLGWMNVWFPTWFYMIWLAALVLLLGNTIQINLKNFLQIIIAFLVFSTIIFITIFAMYIYFSQPGSQYTSGVEGRYFIPVLLLVWFGLQDFTSISVVNTEKRIVRWHIICMSLFVSLSSITIIIVLINRYWIH